MFEFICRVYVLFAGIFGDQATRKRIMYSWSYGISWQKIAKKLWNKDDSITTIKPSGTVSTLSKEGSGIEPHYKPYNPELEIELRNRLKEQYPAPSELTKRIETNTNLPYSAYDAKFTEDNKE